MSEFLDRSGWECDKCEEKRALRARVAALEGECERLMEALQTIVSRGEVCDAKGTHSKAIARAALEGRD